MTPVWRGLLRRLRGGRSGTDQTSSVRDRLLLVRALRAAGVFPLASCVTLQTVIALVPAGTALATGSVIGRAVGAAPEALLGSVAPGLVMLAAVILAGHAAQAFSAPVDYLVVQRVDGFQRAEVARLACASDTVDDLERPEVAELMRTARADPATWAERTPGQGALAQLCLPIRWAGVAVTCLVLAHFSWALVPLVVLPAITARAVWRRQITGHVNRQRTGGTDSLRAEAWKNVALDWTGGKEVRTFGLAGFSVARSAHHRLLVSAPRWRSEARGAALQWIIVVIVGPPLAVTYVWVAWSAVHSEISVALLAAVFSAAWSVLRAMGPRDAFDIEGALPAVRALADLEEMLGGARTAPPSRVDPPQYRPGAAPPLIRFDDVAFAYPGRDHPVLDGVDLEIQPGELLALVGLNGAGKSTLIKLLCGLLRPDSGHITADGTDIEEIGSAAWRRQLAVVWQDFIQYPLTAEENVMLGRPSFRPSPGELAVATTEAHLAPLLDRLPRGWHTPLSRSRSGGVELSGGEWQQIVLARALYALHAGARVLVMDEPTAHLDIRTEFEVFSRLASQKGRNSVLLISHRLSTVRQADRIVLMENGRISESGTHDELLRQRGAYARMFALQAERFRGAGSPGEVR